ncbi:MAG TPA: YraN family protein [Candidatus Coprenecus stercoravium]|uniref:UPF0102 protein IAC04_01710 n=1 Tax=Candidatus Coprenecus stercoravium TaxID=2840735 RepID=A0A9D2GN47_9BACT|nr:YraN family protein [Candidatus Coprenecus stercoravium]
MRRRDSMQRPVNIGGTGRERRQKRTRELEKVSAGVSEGANGNRRHVTGKLGEDKALEYLLQNGYKLIERNWRCGHKEVDLIMESKDGLHIVEVKTRTAPADISPEQAVNREKQLRLEVAAGSFLKRKGYGSEVHFDIVSVILDKDSNVRDISLIKDAYIPIAGKRQNITT